jgi:hypothetical protein
MSWTIRGQKKYYYQSARIGSKCVRHYLGSGPEAERTADEIRRRKDAQVAEADALHSDEERYTAAVAPLLELFNLTDLITKATLVGCGFHRHSRGAWRCRRNEQNSHS